MQIKKLDQKKFKNIGYQARLLSTWIILSAMSIGYLADNMKEVVKEPSIPYVIGTVTIGLLLFFGNKR